MTIFFFFFSSRRRHTRLQGDWSSDVCSSDLTTRSSCSRALVPMPLYSTSKCRARLSGFFMRVYPFGTCSARRGRLFCSAEDAHTIGPPRRTRQGAGRPAHSGERNDVIDCTEKPTRTTFSRCLYQIL